MLRFRRRKRRISMKRRLQWLGAWSVVILAFVLAGGIVAAAVSGIKDVCDLCLVKQSEKDKGQSVQAMVKEDESAGKEAEATLDYVDETKSAESEWEMESQDASSDREVDFTTLLVNKSSYLPTDYTVALTTLKNGQQVASVMYEDLRNMLFDGEEKEQGLSFLVASGYRSSEKQQQLLEEEIVKNTGMGMNEEEARADALLTVAPAHYSEHETGLAVDIVAVTNQRLDETQESTPENIWLQENCYKYGFILRYPRGKEEITGFSYESWHFRYVGKDVAKEIQDRGITLEEYLAEPE